MPVLWKHIIAKEISMADLKANEIVKEVNDLVSKAEADYTSNDVKDVSMDDYSNSASQDPDSGGEPDVDTASLDSQGQMIQIGDIVDSTKDDDKVGGIVTSIGRQIDVEWQNGDTSKEAGINLILSDEDADEYSKSFDEIEEPDFQNEDYEDETR